MTPQAFRFAYFVIGALGFTSLVTTPAQAIGPDQAKAEQIALATAQKDSKITLEDGINASAREGTPISAKFEMEGEHLQFSTYAMKGGDLTEVVVDPASGALKSAEKITDAEDLTKAIAQRAAMEKATVSLLTAAQNAARGNSGAQLISIMPELQAGQPVATVILLRNDDFSTITEKLD